jgi:ribonucleotide reductase beta subunit family protein with ferritin-like domain
MKRYSLYPIVHHDIMEHYFEMRKKEWKEHIIVSELKSDRKDIGLLNEGDDILMRNMLGYQTVVDGFVMENIATKLQSHFSDPEYRLIFAYQSHIEGIHMIVYGTSVLTYYGNDQRIFNSLETNPSVLEKKKWVERYLNNDSVAVQIVASAMLEGVDIKTSFEPMFYFRSKGIAPALSKLNEYVFRDELDHETMYALIYSKMSNRVSKNLVRTMYSELEHINIMFYSFMKEHVYVGISFDAVMRCFRDNANTNAQKLGYGLIFSDASPGIYSQSSSIGTRSTSFFTSKSTEYTDPDFTSEDLKLTF